MDARLTVVGDCWRTCAQAVREQLHYDVIHPVLSMYYLVAEKMDRDRGVKENVGGSRSRRASLAPPPAATAFLPPATAPPSLTVGPEAFPEIVFNVDTGISQPPQPVGERRERSSSTSGSVRSASEAVPLDAPTSTPAGRASLGANLNVAADGADGTGQEANETEKKDDRVELGRIGGTLGGWVGEGQGRVEWSMD